MDKLFDLIIIGAGPGGYVAAEHAAKFGMKVAVVEERELGGTCINCGCIPTKALIYAARLYSILGSCDQFGLRFERMGFDLEKIFSYKEDAVRQFREKIQRQFEESKITYIQGHARIIGSKSVRVESRDGSEATFGAQNILIASGASPARPIFPGSLLPGVITSQEVLNDPVWNYDRLVIIGGGVVGIEFATIFNALGSRVSILEQGERLLPPMDEELSENLELLLRGRGINVYTSVRVERITEQAGLTCHFTDREGGVRQLSADRILLAVGRRANLDDLTGDNVTLETRKGRIAVDGDFMTSLRGVYAVGDVIEGVQLAHLASAEGIHVVEKLCGKPSSVLLSTVPSGAFIDLPIVPSCIYIDPEIASVGITEAKAKQHGIAVKCGRYAISGNGKAILSKEETGFIKLVFEAHSRMLIGAQMICPRATDMIGELATAIANGLTARHLMFAMRAHPTFNEGIAEAIRNMED